MKGGRVFSSLWSQRQCHTEYVLNVSLCPKVPTSVDMFCCYGPVLPNGYGACYNPQAHYIIFSVSSFHDNPQTCSAEFVESLARGLLDMQDLCEKHNIVLDSDIKRQGQRSPTQTDADWQKAKSGRQVDQPKTQVSRTQSSSRADVQALKHEL